MKNVLCFCILLSTAYACIQSKTQAPAQEPSFDLGVLDTPEVQTITAQMRTLTHPIQAQGRIKAAYEETLYAPQGGLLKFCKARNGLRVSRDEVIALLDTEHLELRRERLLAQKLHAQKEFESQFLGYESLLREKSAQEAEVVRQKLRAATGLTALEIDLRELAREMERARITAPADGILTQVAIQEGMTLRPGQELFRLYSAGQLFLQAKVLESDLPYLRLGQRATVRPMAQPDRHFTATLHEIDPYVDENGLVTLSLRMHQPQGLYLGMHAQAEIEVPGKRGILVPRQAVVQRNNRPVVFTYENGAAQWHYVSTGQENGNEIEITSGLAPGSEVIISNNVQLAHLAQVKKGLSQRSGSTR